MKFNGSNVQFHAKLSIRYTKVFAGCNFVTPDLDHYCFVQNHRSGHSDVKIETNSKFQTRHTGFLKVLLLDMQQDRPHLI